MNNCKPNFPKPRTAEFYFLMTHEEVYLTILVIFMYKCKLNSISIQSRSIQHVTETTSIRTDAGLSHLEPPLLIYRFALILHATCTPDIDLVGRQRALAQLP